MRTCTPRSRQRAHLGERGAKVHSGQRPDQIGGLGDRDEFRRR